MGSDRVAELLSHLAPPRRDEVAAIAALGELLSSQEAEIATAWPSLTIRFDRYLAHLAQRLSASRAAEPADRVLRTMPAPDLYLAAACADGDEQAIALFQQTLVPDLRRALGKLSAPSSTLDDAVQKVTIGLFVGERPQIAGYAGRGTLRSWLRTIGVRTTRRLLGETHGNTNDDGDDELAKMPGAVRDPELAMLQERYRDAVKAAFASAFGQLTPRDRNILRQYYIDELTIDDLAALYRVNRATTARWVAGARLAVVKSTRAQLVDTHAVPVSQVDSVIRLVRSQLHLSVRDLTG